LSADMAWDFGVCGRIGLFGGKVEAEGLSGGAYALIERQQRNTRNHGTRKQSRSQGESHPGSEPARRETDGALARQSQRQAAGYSNGPLPG